MTAEDRRWPFRRIPGPGQLAVRKWEKFPSRITEGVIDTLIAGQCEAVARLHGQEKETVAEAYRTAVDLLRAASFGEEGGEHFWSVGTTSPVKPPPIGGSVCSGCGREVFGGVGAVLPKDHVCLPGRCKYCQAPIGGGASMCQDCIDNEERRDG